MKIFHAQQILLLCLFNTGLALLFYPFWGLKEEWSRVFGKKKILVIIYVVSSSSSAPCISVGTDGADPVKFARQTSSLTFQARQTGEILQESEVWMVGMKWRRRILGMYDNTERRTRTDESCKVYVGENAYWAGEEEVSERVLWGRVAWELHAGSWIDAAIGKAALVTPLTACSLAASHGRGD